ncbi:MAG TPA: hypothetical protein VK860_07595 [Ilumatobacteraceae bacterium]|nr:hypothetical protein [Ilumatobacteraceae bacterium]
MAMSAGRSAELDVVVESHEMVVEGLQEAEDDAQDHVGGLSISLDASDYRHSAPPGGGRNAVDDGHTSLSRSASGIDGCEYSGCSIRRPWSW